MQIEPLLAHPTSAPSSGAPILHGAWTEEPNFYKTKSVVTDRRETIELAATAVVSGVGSFAEAIAAAREITSGRSSTHEPSQALGVLQALNGHFALVPLVRRSRSITTTFNMINGQDSKFVDDGRPRPWTPDRREVTNLGNSERWSLNDSPIDPARLVAVFGDGDGVAMVREGDTFRQEQGPSIPT